MKRLATTLGYSLGLSLGLMGAVALGGCAATTSGGLHSADADTARHLMAEHCVVGRTLQGIPATPIYMREGVDSLRSGIEQLNYKHPVDPDRVTVYGIRDGRDGWVVVDASSQRVRDNFYFHRQTGAVICSEDEWRAAGGGLLDLNY